MSIDLCLASFQKLELPHTTSFSNEMSINDLKKLENFPSMSSWFRENLGTDIKAIDLDEKMVALLDEAADILSVTRD